jgi:hypothetical protein
MEQSRKEFFIKAGIINLSILDLDGANILPLVATLLQLWDLSIFVKK